MKTRFATLWAALIAVGVMGAMAWGQDVPAPAPKIDAPAPPKVDAPAPPKIDAPAPTDAPPAPKPDAPPANPDAPPTPKPDAPPARPDAPPAPRPDAPAPPPAENPNVEKPAIDNPPANNNPNGPNIGVNVPGGPNVRVNGPNGANPPGVGVNVPGGPNVRVNTPGVGVNAPGARVNAPGVGVNAPGVNVGVNANANAGFTHNGRNWRGPDVGLWFTPTNNYLLINEIGTTGPIANLGFRRNDYIMSVNGTRVVTEAAFLQALSQAQGRVQVAVWRGGQQQIVWVDPTVLFADQQTAVDPMEQFGVILDDRYANQAIVWRVIPQSPAFYAGVRTGDTLVAFNNRPINGVRGFTTLLQGATGNVALQVNRNRQIRTLNATLAANANARGEVREALRPNLDAPAPGDARVDRREDRIDRNADPKVDTPPERRLDRIEDRAERRDEIRAGVNPNAVPDNNPAPAAPRATARPRVRLFGR